MDTQLRMVRHYRVDDKGKPVSLRDDSALVSAQDFTCATCLKLMKGIARYRRLERQALLGESAKKLIVLANRVYVPLANELSFIVQFLSELNPQVNSNWPEVIEIGGTRWDQVSAMRDVVNETNYGRWDAILDLRERIEWHRRLIQPEVETMQNVQDLLKKTIGDGNKRNLSSVIALLQTKVLLQADVLLVSLDIALLTDFSTLVSEARSSKAQPWKVTLNLDMHTIEDDCIWLIQEAINHQRLFYQAEGYLYLALAHAFERKNSLSPGRRETLAHQIRETVARGKAICHLHPDQTPGLLPQLDSVVVMLNKNTVHTVITSQERFAAISNMALELQESEK
ncbi:hypothetical protein LTR66_016240, partial [Elasticomyces elasticus]